jgi:hypothetical protein
LAFLSIQLIDIERNTSFSSLSSSPQDLYQKWEKGWSQRFSINAPSTRNSQLAALVGEMFHQVGREMAERIVAAQFTTKTVRTQSTLEEHLLSFKRLWAGLHERWLGRLSGLEREHFQAMETQAERDAFRIIRSYHCKAVTDAQPDFPVAVGDLGQRLGITMQGAGKMRRKFETAGIIKLTRHYQVNKRAARYKWLTGGT